MASLLLLLVFSFMAAAVGLQPAQQWSLLKIQQLLNYPPYLAGWHGYTDFCYSPPPSSPSPAAFAGATVVCYDDTVTQLHISGAPGAPPLPDSFSPDSFFTTLSKLADLKVLTLSNLGIRGELPAKLGRLSSLEILNVSSNYINGTLPRSLAKLGNLTALILDLNGISGGVPEWLPEMPSLTVLSLRGNKLQGTVPEAVAAMPALRVLDLSDNALSGEVPDLAALVNLQVLRLEGNALGPGFPALGKKVETVALRGNRFTGGLPPELAGAFLLKELDVSANRFVGPFMPALLALPSLQYLNVSGNRFTGMLASNMTCGDNLAGVDLSANLLTGVVPACLKKVSFSGNCFGNGDRTQHPLPYCERQALAVGIRPPEQQPGAEHRTGTLPAVVAGAVTAAIATVLLAGAIVFHFLRKRSIRRAAEKPPRRLVEHAGASGGYSSKLLADARYISQTVKLGALGIPPCRAFSLVELEAATNNFETARLLWRERDSGAQMYRGTLSSGNCVAIRCVKTRKNQTSQSLSRHVEVVSRLRHRHLVSTLGHCFEYNLDDSTVTRLFLVFEHMANGDLRSRVSGSAAEGRRLTWSQRISAAIGVAKGIEFLHSGIIPGVFANNLKITDVVLDQNLTAKICSYSLPIVAESLSSSDCRMIMRNGDKADIYDFGVILLEIVSGTPVGSKNDIEVLKGQLQLAVAAEAGERRRIFADAAVRRSSSEESLKTVMEICLRCLSEEAAARPPVEDVLWNLQFAAQVQESWRGDSLSSEEAPLSPSLAAARASLN